MRKLRKTSVLLMTFLIITSIVFSNIVVLPGAFCSVDKFRRLTDNGHSDGNPKIHNGKVTWRGAVGSDLQIFLYDGSSTTQLTDNGENKGAPQIHNGQVVWSEGDSNSIILLYNGSSTIVLSNPLWSGADFDPQIHNGQVTWDYDDFLWGNIWLYNGSSTINLTYGNSLFEEFPQIHNGQVVWQGGLSFNEMAQDREIFLYNGSSILQLTNNSYYDGLAQIHNGQVTWQGHDGHDYEIFMYDGLSTIQLTNNSYNDYAPQIHNGQVTWHGSGEIFLYNGSKIQLTNNSISDIKPQIHNGQVTWKGHDGSDYEIFLYDGTSIIQITNNSYVDNDPQIHNGQVVWQGHDGSDYEIFLYPSIDLFSLWDYIEDWIITIQDQITDILSTLSGITVSLSNIWTEIWAIQDRVDSLEAENPANWINLDSLPGTRINIYTEGEFQISAKETTHIWQGWYAGPWSTLDEAQRTEFLATAEVHFYVNDEEISLKPLVVYDEENDRMWSGYYRVFPPSYFELNRNNKLTAEWFRMRDGEWRSIHRTALLRIK